MIISNHEDKVIHNCTNFSNSINASPWLWGPYIRVLCSFKIILESLPLTKMPKRKQCSKLYNLPHSIRLSNVGLQTLYVKHLPLSHSLLDPGEKGAQKWWGSVIFINLPRLDLFRNFLRWFIDLWDFMGTVSKTLL